MASARGQKLIVNNNGLSQKDVWFDPDKIDKIIYNLVSNAIKYNKDNGLVTVTLTMEKTQPYWK